MSLLQFLAVGSSGVVVNLAVLTILLVLGAADWVSLAGGIGVSLFTNFLLNRRFTFGYARSANFWKQLAGFVSASSLGLVINYSVSLFSLSQFPESMPNAPQFAALIGIGCGMTFNYIGSRFFVFRRKFYKEDQ